MYSKEANEATIAHSDSIYLYQSKNLTENGIRIVDLMCYKRLQSLFRKIILIRNDEIQIVLFRNQFKRALTKGIESFGWWEDVNGLRGRVGGGEHFWNPLESSNENRTREEEAPNWAQAFFG